jgi:hypothetical protein
MAPELVLMGGPRDARVVVLHGAAMRTKGALMDEFARACEFPDYFGRNWSALEDCLQDMTWFEKSEKYLLVIAEAPLVLQDSPGDFDPLVETLEAVGSIWAEHGHGAGSVAFNTVLADTQLE